MYHYETVFILNPVLSKSQIEETVNNYKNFIREFEAEIIATENWGLKKLAYPINRKTSGFYHLIEYKSTGELVENLELQFRRDERVLRFLTVKLDRHALAWASKRREKLENKKEKVETKTSSSV